MSAWWLIAPGALGCLAVLVTAARLAVPKPKHAVPRRLPRPEASITSPPVPPPAGSMILAEERGLYWPAPTRWEDGNGWPYIPDWREQTAAELSPETLAHAPWDGPWPSDDRGLDAEVMPDASAVAMHLPGVQGSTAPVSPGPGDLPSLTAPGPDPDHIHNGSCSDHRCWNGGPGRLCGPEQPHEKPAGTESAGSGHLTAEQAELVAQLERLADTGDIRDARLLADVQAYLRAQDDDARAYCSALELGRREYMHQLRLDLTEALA